MAIYERLTDRTLATGVTLNDFVHVVITGDTSQNVAGSSYKATIQQIANAITGTTGSSGTSGASGTSGSSGTNGTGGTNGTSGTDGTNGSSGISGLGLYLPLSGGTVTGETIFQSGLTANTLNISSTPTTNETNTDVLVRNTTTGNIEKRTLPTTTVYGLFTQTGDSETVSGTTEQSIIGPGIGGFTVGANQFKNGDTFRAIIRGYLSNNNDYLQIRVKSDSIVLADSTSIQYNTSGEETLMSLDLNFIIIQTGGTGTASILTKGYLKTIKNSNFTVNGYSFESLNNTTFDTTISNTLDVTFQFDATDTQTYVYTDFFVLDKVF